MKVHIILNKRKRYSVWAWYSYADLWSRRGGNEISIYSLAIEIGVVLQTVAVEISSKKTFSTSRIWWFNVHSVHGVPNVGGHPDLKNEIQWRWAHSVQLTADKCLNTEYNRRIIILKMCACSVHDFKNKPCECMNFPIDNCATNIAKLTIISMPRETLVDRISKNQIWSIPHTSS